MHLSSTIGLEHDASVWLSDRDGVDGKKFVKGSWAGERDNRAFFVACFVGVLGTLDLLGLRFRLFRGDGLGVEGGIGFRSTSS